MDFSIYHLQCPLISFIEAAVGDIVGVGEDVVMRKENMISRTLAYFTLDTPSSWRVKAVLH